MVTVGGQQALDLIARVFLDPGDVVLAEGPSYVGALGVFQAAQAQVVHVAMDDDGLIPEALEAAIAAVAAAGKRAKFLYTIPTYPEPGRRDPHRGSAASRSSTSASAPGCWWSRTTRTGCSASTATPRRRCGPDAGTASST